MRTAGEMMKMTMSSLAVKSFYTPNKSSRGGLKICKFTPHHMAGNLSIESCANLFSKSSRQASSNYLIGTDGRIGCDVPEEYRAWTSSSKWNDQRAITVEVANSTLSPTWKVSSAAWDSLVKLAADVCERYGFRLNYTGNKNGSLTLHRFYSNTNCPGNYIDAHIRDLEKQVNELLDSGSVPSRPESQAKYSDELGYWDYFGPKFARAFQEQIGTVVDGIISGQPVANKKYFWAVDGGVTYGDSGSDAILALQIKLQKAGYDPKGLDRYYGRGCITAHQQCLKDHGYDLGPSGVDGFHGHDMNEAIGQALTDGFYAKEW